MTCQHENVSHGQVYDYCTDCGAVKHREEKATGWHSCEKCRLSQSKEQTNATK
jgi:hypothetical protein